MAAAGYRKYLIRTSHPRGYHNGLKIVKVHNSTYEGKVHVTGYGLGCSRDYRTDSDLTAIDCLLAEHAMMRVGLNYDTGENVRLLENKVYGK